MTTALVADDEPLMLERLCDALAVAWPSLTIVARCRNGDWWFHVSARVRSRFA